MRWLLRSVLVAGALVQIAVLLGFAWLGAAAAARGLSQVVESSGIREPLPVDTGRQLKPLAGDGLMRRAVRGFCKFSSGGLERAVNTAPASGVSRFVVFAHS